MDTQEFKTLSGTTEIASLSTVIPYKLTAVSRKIINNPSFLEKCKELVNYYFYRNDCPDFVDSNVIVFYCLNDEDLKEILEFWRDFNFPEFSYFQYGNFNIITLDRENEVFKFPIYMEMLLTFNSIIRETYNLLLNKDNIQEAIKSLETKPKYQGIKFILNFVKKLPQNLREQISLEDFYSNYTNGILSAYQKQGSGINEKIKQWTKN